MRLRKVLVLSIVIIAALCGLVLVGSSVLKERVYGGFLTKAESIHVGDSAETVKAKMAPHQATTNNSDLTLPESRVVVFRRFDVILIVHLDEKGQVQRIEKRGT